MHCHGESACQAENYNSRLAYSTTASHCYTVHGRAYVAGAESSFELAAVIGSVQQAEYMKNELVWFY